MVLKHQQNYVKCANVSSMMLIGVVVLRVLMASLDERLRSKGQVSSDETLGHCANTVEGV